MFGSDYKPSSAWCNINNIKQSLQGRHYKAELGNETVDHVIAEKHGGLTDISNLALACIIFNKHKGSDIASIDRETRNYFQPIDFIKYGVQT